MDQTERRAYLIRYLQGERWESGEGAVPAAEAEQKRLLRALMNVRMPGPIGEDFLKVQDEYLREAARKKGIVSLEDLQTGA